MKPIRFLLGLVILLALAGGVWLLVYHSNWLKDAPEAEEEQSEPSEVPVKVAKIQRTTLHRYVEGFGSIEPEPAINQKPSASAALTPPAPGIVAKVDCWAGQKVQAGQVLFEMDDRQAKAAVAQAAAALESAGAARAKVQARPRPEQLALAKLVVDKARSSLEFAQRAYDRQKILAQQQGTSQKSLESAESDLAAARNELNVAQEQLKLLNAPPVPQDIAEADAKVNEAQNALAAARTQQSLLQIRSPLAGTVTRIGVNPGESVDVTRILAEVVALDRLCAMVNVPAQQASFVKQGQEALFQLDAAPSTQPATQPSAPRELSSKVEFVWPAIDRKTDSLPVCIAIPPAPGLLPGRAVRARIVVEEHPDCLAVPSDSISKDEEGNPVISIVTGQIATQIPVTIGLSEDDLVEIRAKNIHEGDAVVAQGAYGLPKETRIKLIQE